MMAVRFDATISLSSILIAVGMLGTVLFIYFTGNAMHDQRLTAIEARQDERLKQERDRLELDKEWRGVVIANMKELNNSLAQLNAKMAAVQAELKMHTKAEGSIP